MSERKLYQDTNLKIINSITLMAVLGVSSITPAFPRIQQAFNVTAEQTGLLITFFTLPGVLLTPILGILADRFGRKRILVPSLFLFGIAGTICFFLRDFQLLILFRFLQGVGAASLGTLNVTLIGDIYSGKDRSTAMGYNASVLSIGTASYPAIGGALALIGWFVPFILPVLAVPVGLVVLYKLKNPEPESKQRLKEYLGNTFKSIKNIQVIILFSISIITFIILYGAYLSFFPFLASHRFEASSFEIGVLMSSMSITTAITSSQIGKLTELLSERILIKLGFILYTVSLILIPLMGNLWMLLVPVIIFGAAQGMNMPSFLTLLTGFAPIEHRAAFMSLNGMVLRLGQTLGPLIMGFVFGMLGIEFVFYAGAVLAVIMLSLIMVFLERKD